jgi:hypothetical protein
METLTTKIASCRQNLELAEAGVEWQPATATVRIHWLASPSGSPEVLSFAIGPDGNPGPLRPAAR